MLLELAVDVRSLLHIVGDLEAGIVFAESILVLGTIDSLVITGLAISVV